MTDSTQRRVAITGVGVVAANGIGKEAFWQAISKGTSGIKPISSVSSGDFPISIGGEISDFEVHNFIDRKLARNTDRVTHFALAASQEALQDANIIRAEEDPQCVGAVIANTLGGLGLATQQSLRAHA